MRAAMGTTRSSSRRFPRSSPVRHRIRSRAGPPRVCARTRPSPASDVGGRWHIRAQCSPDRMAVVGHLPLSMSFRSRRAAPLPATGPHPILHHTSSLKHQLTAAAPSPRHPIAPYHFPTPRRRPKPCHSDYPTHQHLKSTGPAALFVAVTPHPHLAPGDLFNEFILVIYMILVIGQSMAFQP